MDPATIAAVAGSAAMTGATEGTLIGLARGAIAGAAKQAAGAVVKSGASKVAGAAKNIKAVREGEYESKQQKPTKSAAQQHKNVTIGGDRRNKGGAFGPIKKAPKTSVTGFKSGSTRNRGVNTNMGGMVQKPVG